MSAVVLRRIDPERDTFRFYRLDVPARPLRRLELHPRAGPHRAARHRSHLPLPHRGRGPCRAGAPAAGEETPRLRAERFLTPNSFGGTANPLPDLPREDVEDKAGRISIFRTYQDSTEPLKLLRRHQKLAQVCIIYCI